MQEPMKGMAKLSYDTTKDKYFQFGGKRLVKFPSSSWISLLLIMLMGLGEGKSLYTYCNMEVMFVWICY